MTICRCQSNCISGPATAKHFMDRAAGAVESVRTLSGHTVPFDDLHAGDHIYTVNLKGVFSHHGIVVKKGSNPGTTEVVEFNVPRGGPLPERVTPKEMMQPALLQRMVAAAKVQRITLLQFLTSADSNIEDGAASPSGRTKNLRRVHYGDIELVRVIARCGSAHTQGHDPADVVIKRALERLERQDWPPYAAVTNNCEHFAVYCKTGNPKSCQISRIPEQHHEHLQASLDNGMKAMANMENKMRSLLTR